MEVDFSCVSKVIADGLHAFDSASHLQCLDVKVRTRERRSLIWRWQLDESISNTIHFEAEYHTSTDGLGNWCRKYSVL